MYFVKDKNPNNQSVFNQILDNRDGIFMITGG